jgi:Carboxypeptidase regulatory-like domain
MMSPRFVACLLLALASLPSFAASEPEARESAPMVVEAGPLGSPSEPGQVRVDGVVQDDSGALLPGAKLHFVGETGFAADVTADAVGAFHIDLPAGSYRVSAVQAGFQQTEEPLIVRPAAAHAEPEDCEGRGERDRHGIRRIRDHHADDRGPGAHADPGSAAVRLYCHPPVAGGPRRAECEGRAGWRAGRGADAWRRTQGFVLDPRLQLADRPVY